MARPVLSLTCPQDEIAEQKRKLQKESVKVKLKQKECQDATVECCK